ncbi:MAG: class I SAM-dependent methyltransferase [Oscillospiraceae bacterium]
MDYVKYNEDAWDSYAQQDDIWTRPVTPEEFEAAKNGALELYLTPAKTVPRDWYPPLSGRDVLGLASGGGQQGPVFAAHGANVTIMDISDNQLKLEQAVADREGYTVKLVKADMTQPFPFADESFDLIFHPVANCYIEELQPVWNECYRVLKKGGVLLTGFAKEELFLFETDHSKDPPLFVKYALPFNPLKNPQILQDKRNVTRACSFSHTLEEQLGGQLAAGFTITGIYDDRERGGVFANYFNNYAATRAVKM